MLPRVIPLGPGGRRFKSCLPVQDFLRPTRWTIPPLAREPKPSEDGDVVRVEIAEDSVLLRDGVARLLEDADFDLVASGSRRG